MVQKAVIISAVKNQYELITVLLLPIEYGSLQCNMASNLLFPYMLLFSGNILSCSDESHFVVYAMIFVHLLVFALT